MELTGSLTSQVAHQKLWDSIMSTSFWKEAVPDVERYELIGQNLYEMLVKMDIGPIKGNQNIKIQFSDLLPPRACKFDVQNSLIKTARGSFSLVEPSDLPDSGVVIPNPIPENTQTVLGYNLEIDAGNPFFNAMLEGFKDKIQQGFEELLGRLETHARNSHS